MSNKDKTIVTVAEPGKDLEKLHAKVVLDPNLQAAAALQDWLQSCGNWRGRSAGQSS